MNIAEAMANVLKSDKSTLGERAALSTVFKPGSMALNKWLGTPTKNVGDYLPAGHVGQNWIYHPTNKNLVQVTHGSTNIADIIDGGFNPNRGPVFITPDARVSNRVVQLPTAGPKNTWIPNPNAAPGSGSVRGWVDKNILARGLALSNLGEVEALMNPAQANKIFGVGPKPSITNRISNVFKPTVIPNEYLGPINIDKRLGLTKDDYAFSKIMGQDAKSKATLGLAKNLGRLGRAIPFAGAGLGAVDVTRRVNRDDWLGAGLSGLGMIPVAGIPALAGLAAYDAYDIVNNPRTGPEPMRIPSAFTTPQYGSGAYRN